MNDGVSFEVKVERWLIKRGARFTERRTRQRGKLAVRGHECDVHATMVSPLWRLAAVVAVICGLGCIVTGLTSDEPVWAILPGALGVAAVTVLALFFVGPAHVWVEVKSGEATVTRDVVWKLAEQVDDVRRLAVPAWYPSNVWLVAKSRFDIDALTFARKHGVRCFVEQGSDIREVL